MVRDLFAAAGGILLLAGLLTPVVAALIKRVPLVVMEPNAVPGVTNRWIGNILRKRLNLRTYKSHGVYVVPSTELPKVQLLCARYGGNPPVSAAVYARRGHL